MRYSYNVLQIAILVCLEVSEIAGQAGEWTPWSQWSSCSVSCGYGVNKRQRTWHRDDGVTSREPIVYEDILECITSIPCPRNGSWGYWGPWSECTKMCDGGVTTRKRECNNPKPSAGGLDCEGKNFASISCNDWACPALPPNFDIRQCNETTYMCLSEEQCIPQDERCDNKLQCHDGSDEYNCYYIDNWNNGGPGTSILTYFTLIWTIVIALLLTSIPPS